jgi:hypothetical protein
MPPSRSGWMLWEWPLSNGSFATSSEINQRTIWEGVFPPHIVMYETVTAKKVEIMNYRQSQNKREEALWITS